MAILPLVAAARSGQASGVSDTLETEVHTLDDRALVVIDVQQGFDDPSWGARNNRRCEANVAALIETWRRHGRPIVFVRHDSRDPCSPLAAGSPGNGFKQVVTGAPDLLVRKSVHSAFYGQPDLDQWLRRHAVTSIAICGIQTNHCCETTARMASDLGYEVAFVLDATHTFDHPALDGTTVTADELTRATAASLQAEFATVMTTATALGGIARGMPPP